MGEPLDRFVLPDGDYEGLSILVSLGRQGVNRLIEELAKEKLTLDLDAVAGRLAEALGLPESAMDRLLSTVLIPLNQARQSSSQSPADFLRELSVSLERQAPMEWWREFGERWREVASDLEPLFAADRFLWFAARAAQLLYNRSALLLDFKILTELRPVFDESVGSLCALLLSNTLVVTYQQDEREHVLHLSIDSEDLRVIGEQLERARRKNELVLQEATPWQIDVLA